MFSNKMLYIPDYVVYEDTPKIIHYFENFNIATVKDVKIYPHIEPEYYAGGDHLYGYAVIEIDHYHDNQGAINFYKSIENNKGLMVYDDPLYWVVQFYTPMNDNKTNYAENYSSQSCDTSKLIAPLCDVIANMQNSNSNNNSNNEVASDQEYYSSDDQDVSKDPDYVYQEDSSEDDDYNYSNYVYNFNSFKNKQKTKKQKLDTELFEIKKSLNSIKNAHNKLHTLLVINNKQKNNKPSNPWSRRLRTTNTDCEIRF